MSGYGVLSLSEDDFREPPAAFARPKEVPLGETRSMLVEDPDLSGVVWGLGEKIPRLPDYSLTEFLLSLPSRFISSYS